MGSRNYLSIKDFQSKQEGKIQRDIEKVICRRMKIMYLGICLGYHTTHCIYNMPIISKLHSLIPLRVIR